MMSQAEMESTILQLKQQVASLQEQIQSVAPRTGTKEGMFHPILDANHVGYWDDLFIHGSKAIAGPKVTGLTHKAQRCYHQDPSGRIGKDWVHIVQASNGEWLAVSGWVP